MSKIKVGDKVRVLRIPGVNMDNHPDIKENIFTVEKVPDSRNSNYLLDSNYFAYGEEDLELVSTHQDNLGIQGHLWLIVNRANGKVVEGYETRKEARENLESNYDDCKKFKIVKYEFK